MRKASDYLKEANAVVPRLDTKEALALYGSDTIFVDVRDSASIAETGTIKGALRIPRGMMEFTADEESKLHNSALQKDAKIALVCGAGGQAALAGKTMLDMGYKDVVNIGGFGDWKKAGGECEEA